MSEKLLETLNCRVTYQQCMYKYNALKKKWKEVIDSPSGSETKHFTHKDEFDQLYGTKARTKPQYTIDTDNTERKRQQENVWFQSQMENQTHLLFYTDGNLVFEFTISIKEEIKQHKTVK